MRDERAAAPTSTFPDSDRQRAIRYSSDGLINPQFKPTCRKALPFPIMSLSRGARRERVFSSRRSC